MFAPGIAATPTEVCSATVIARGVPSSETAAQTFVIGELETKVVALVTLLAEAGAAVAAVFAEIGVGRSAIRYLGTP